MPKQKYKRLTQREKDERAAARKCLRAEGRDTFQRKELIDVVYPIYIL